MKKIEEIVRLKELKKEVEELHNKITKYSVYPGKQLVNTLSKLATEFEGKKYIGKIIIRSSRLLVYSIDEAEKFQYCIESDMENCESIEVSDDQFVIYPTEDNETIESDKQEKIPSYISNFINYVFEIRVERDLINITEEDLNEILEDYIKKEKEDQKQKEYQIKVEQDILKRTAFEQTCMVDRESFFEAIANVITNSNEKATSGTHYEKKLDKNSKEDTLLLSHSVYILANGRLRDFKVFLDKVEIPREKENEIQFDSTKKPYINFFEIKNYFSYAYENLDCFKQFMDDVEALYEEKRVLEKGDINYVVENRNKDTNKVIKKQWNDKSGSL